MKTYLILTVIFLLTLYFPCSAAAGLQLPNQENKTAVLQINDSPKRIIKSIIDKKSDRQIVSDIESSLYEISYGNRYDLLRVIKSLDADSITYKQTDSEIELKFWHSKDIKIEVTCKISGVAEDSLLRWSIGIKNLSKEIICTVEYPIISCKNTLGNKSSDDAIVYPIHEGVLLTKMNEPGPRRISNRYPGIISAQFMYFYDPSGGFYYAAYDGNGYPKDITAHGGVSDITLSQKYILPISYEEQIEMPYEVVTGCFGGRWEDGASVYREWSDKQIWTEKTISQRSTPSWLKEPNLFINDDFFSKNSEVEQADQMIKEYHDFFEVPIVTTVFSWEKHGIWIGPDYFPPNPNKQFYLDLITKLDIRGDHLHFYTSGFRWGVKKPIDESGSEPRVYTDYDGTAMFMEQGKDFAVTDKFGQLVLRKPRWADNYIMCAGSEGARNILDTCYNYIYDLGVAGVDLDQNLGGEVDICYNEFHGHPKGAGLWQTASMKKFLEKIESDNIKRGNKFFQGVEEPSEPYIPYLDVFHGRCFTGTLWPIAVSIPLYNYLYHQYQIAYAGWIDDWFSPCGYEKYGLGRAFIFGMYPGIRVRGNMVLIRDNPSAELKMLQGYVGLMKESPEFLLRGRMIGEIKTEGSTPFDESVGTEKDKIPVQWNSVQGICWLSEDGNKTAYALANLSDKVQQIRVKLVNHQESDTYNYSGYVMGNHLDIKLISHENNWISFSMEPWELAIVKTN